MAGAEFRRAAEALVEILAEEAFEEIGHVVAVHCWEASAGRALCMTSIETTAGLTASTTPARLGIAKT